MTSYAAAVNPRAVRFTYIQDIPTETAPVAHPSRALNVKPSDHDKIEHAQARFSGQGPELKFLDTSGELTEYVVDFADGKVVRYRHRYRAAQRLEHLRRMAKLNNQEIQALKKEISDMRQEEREEKDAMIYWQVASNAMTGFCNTLWNGLRQEDKAELQHMNIDNIQALRQFCSPYNQRNTIPNSPPYRIYNSIPQDKKAMLLELSRAKRTVGSTRTSQAHPESRVSYFRTFIRRFLDPSKVIESELEALETMEICIEGEPYRLFIDDVAPITS